MVGFGQFDRIRIRPKRFGPNRIRIHNTGQKAMIFQNGAVTNKN